VRVNDKSYGNTEEEYQEICNFLDMLSTQDPVVSRKVCKLDSFIGIESRL
jgi:hypothetical protein